MQDKSGHILHFLIPVSLTPTPHVYRTADTTVATPYISHSITCQTQSWQHTTRHTCRTADTNKATPIMVSCSILCQISTMRYLLLNSVLTTHYTSMQGLLTPLKPSLSWLKHGVHECLAGMADLFLTPTSVYLSTNLQVWIQFKYCFTSSHVCHQPWTPSPAMRHRSMIQKLTQWQ